MSSRQRLAVLVAAVLCLLVLPVAPVVNAQVAGNEQQTGSLRSIAEWQRMFDEVAEDHRAEDMRMSKSMDSWQYYPLAYSIDGYNAMFRASGETRYLDQSLQLINNVVANARKQPDGYLGWRATGNGQNNEETPLYESYMWRYVTETLSAIRSSPKLYNSTKYRNQYDRLLKFTERNMFDKWFSRGVEDNIYRSRTHMASHWALICLNLHRLTTDSARKARCRTVINAIQNNLPNYGGSGLKKQMTKMPSGAYVWNATWKGEEVEVQDVSHGNNVLAYVVEAHEQKVGWTDADMTAFIKTFRAVWPESGKYPEFVDGTGDGDGWFSDGFVKLGRYDRALQKRLESHDVGRDVQLYGNAALNVRYLASSRN